MHAYCLFCQTQKCKSIAMTLEKQCILRAFAPQIYKRQRIRGKIEDKLFDLLPGYIFLFSEKALENLGCFRGIDGIIRRIGTPENHFELAGSDYDFAMNLYRKEGLVGQVKVYKEGDTVRMEDPLFNGCSGRITQIDYRKRRARVEYQFAGMSCFTWIACDLISDEPQHEE